jgi:metal transporter CNNM
MSFHIDWKKLISFPHLLWWDYLIYGGICLFLIGFAGLCSGLTLGLLSIDKLSLSILRGAGSEKEKKYANKLRPILRRYHLLLVTLLLWNALAMEALPLFLDRMVPEFLAVILSVTFVLIFGEVLPQAVISRYGLAIGGNLAWFVHILIIIALPVAYPASKVLDCLLGADNAGTYYKRAELKELVNIHGQPSAGAVLTNDEISVIRGALELKEKKVESIITPINRVYMISIDQRMDEETMDEILKTGHSRVPVYRNGNRQDVVGLLLIKNLIKLNPKDAVPVSQLELRELHSVSAEVQLWDVLNMFNTGKSHMALVKKWLTAQEQKELDIDANANGTKECIIGIVTLEDVFEELIQKEIVDETDVFVDVERQIRVADMFRRITTTIQKKPSLLYLNIPQKSPASRRTRKDRNYGSIQNGHLRTMTGINGPNSLADNSTRSQSLRDSMNRNWRSMDFNDYEESNYLLPPSFQ